MWESLQDQIKRLMASTLVTYGELAEYCETQMNQSVHSTEVSHCVNDARGTTRKGREILQLSVGYLTEKQEQLNKTVKKQIQRAENALQETL